MKGALDCFVSDESMIDGFEDDQSVIYLLDKNLRIVYCNKAWDESAEHNGGVHLRRIEQVGRRVLDSNAEPLKTFYRSAFERALAEHEPWDHLYECSTPGLYREFHMQVLPLQAPPHLIVVNSLVVEKPHQRIKRPPLTALYRTTGGVVTMCMHCRRTRRGEGPDIWDWVPDFLASPPDDINQSRALSNLLSLSLSAYNASNPGLGLSSAGLGPPICRCFRECARLKPPICPRLEPQMYLGGLCATFRSGASL